ncbi:S41 family peptidase [Variovorax sp. PBS-H4]|uniref:S41 family peptidase n=1 Tax=Variovorax sp. PBS-H4 TaxID=434008 RepID=UPI0015758579|nr:S41 family peptidase [Variovorax sp. PBS-H4]
MPAHPPPPAPNAPVAETPVVPQAPPAIDPPEEIAKSSDVAGRCAVPRTGVDPSTHAAFSDLQGTSTLEKNWVRAWIDETYLWYDEVPTYLLAKDYATPVTYFDVLKTPKLTASGRAKDRFHFTADTATSQALSQNGVEAGYGMNLAFLSTAPPRDVRVAFIEPGSPAEQAAVMRGDRLIAVDGADVENGTDVDALNAGIAPRREGETHSFKLRDGTGAERNVTLTSASITRDPVPMRDAVYYDRGQRRIGYMVFNSYIATAEYGLAYALGLFQRIGTTDMVIDMRYNGGGYLDIASQLAFMLSPSGASTGKTFEQLQYNNKNPFHLTPDQLKMPFHDQTLGFSAQPGFALPQLQLSSVTVLTGPDTCSASESVINGLRGIGVTVNVVGGTTCGKPYGFTPQDNCGTTYYAIQFQGVNDRGFGDYGDGIAPTCVVPDDFGHQLGDENEARLAAAFGLIETGKCPAAPLGKASTVLRKAEASRRPYLARSPIWSNKWLKHP